VTEGYTQACNVQTAEYI